MSEELKPCPFCGSQPILAKFDDSVETGLAWTRIYCKTCEDGPSDAEGGPVMVRAASTCHDLAVTHWNRRASPDARREALEEAAKVADEAQATAREEIAEEKAEEGYDPYAFGSGFLSGELTAAVNIAKAIRALKEKNNG